MHDPESIRKTVRSYVENLDAGNAEAILALYGDDPRVEDPVGSDVIAGRDDVLRFYTNASGRLRVELTGAIRVAGNECAFPMLARVDLGEQTMEMDVIDVMQFGADGRVEAMRAFWSPGDMRPVDAQGE